MDSMKKNAGFALGAGVVGAALVAGGAWVGERAGWPLLVAPLQRAAEDALARRVELDGARLGLLGGVRIDAQRFEVGAPAWSDAPFLVRARDLHLELRYVDLWRAWRGAPQRVRALRAAELQADLQRRADGRVSWEMAPGGGASTALPAIESLRLDAGRVRYRDAAQQLDVQARLRAADGAAQGGPDRIELQVDGRYRALPVKVEGSVDGALGAVDGIGDAAAVAVKLDAQVGRSRLRFDGHSDDPFGLQRLRGRFDLRGPSLARVGDVLGVTLPTTAPFRMAGDLQRAGAQWTVQVDNAVIGASRLDGHFVFDADRRVPLLSGRLGGARLLLADLGPAIGAAPPATAASGAAAAPAPAAAASASARVLPDRAFDLPSLRAMDADVRIDLAEVDLGTRTLQPLRPLQAQLRLRDGVLMLSELLASTAQGRLRGELRLDGRQAPARWDADLRWAGVRLEQWVRQPNNADGAPAWIAGRLTGRATVQGSGNSTAQILGSLKGQARAELRRGTVSHLVVEAGGLDIAESLGLLAGGDDALPVNCAVADLDVSAGVLRPKPAVLDTGDSTVWIDGSLSLRAEQLDLRVVVSPKDFSPLTLRAPLRVSGSFADPQLSLQMQPLGLKLAASALLAFVHPLAALVPLVDLGDAEQAQDEAAGCQALWERARRRAS